MTHRQKMKELLPIIQAYCDGAEVEYVFPHGGMYKSAEEPTFDTVLTWRIKQTPDTIDWSHVHKDYKFMARDEDGCAYVFTNKPYNNECHWSGSGVACNHFVSYKQGTVSWEDSLVERPEEV